MKIDTEDTKPMCRRGKMTYITVTAAQQALLRSAFRPVDDWLRQSKLTGQLLDQISALRAAGIKPLPAEKLSFAGVTATASPVSASPTVPTRVTALDGAFRMVTTEQNLRKSHPAVPPENWGTFVYVFDRDRFALTQENATACGWATATRP